MAECYIQVPVDFGAVNTHFSIGSDGLTSGTGVVDGYEGSFSVWFNAPNGGSSQHIYRHTDATGGVLAVLVLSDERISITHTPPGPTFGFIWSSTNSISVDTWHHLLFSWVMDGVTARADFYLDDEVLPGSYTVAPTNNKITNFTPLVSVVGSQLITSVNRYLGCLGDLWIHHLTRVDVTSETVRRNFIDANGFPVDLGATGELPTGTAPLVFLKRDPGDPVNDFTQNRGVGNDYGLPGGILANCADNASQPRPMEATKAFSETNQIAYEATTMTIVIDNDCNTDDALDVSFVDSLPDGLVVASDPAVTNDCGGTVTATPGASTVSLSGGTVGGGLTCTITVALVSSLPAIYNNSVTVTASNLGTSEPALASIQYEWDKITVSPDEDLAYRPDPRIYPMSETHSPRSGGRLESVLDIFRELAELEDDDRFAL
jgi:hypothetical protein